MNPKTEFHECRAGFRRIAFVQFYNGNTLSARKTYMYWIPEGAVIKKGDHLEVLVPNCSQQESKRVYVTKVVDWDDSMIGCNYKRAVGTWTQPNSRFPFQQESPDDYEPEVSYRVKKAISAINSAVDKEACFKLETHSLTAAENAQLHGWFNKTFSMEHMNTQQAMYRGIEIHKIICDDFDDKIDATIYANKFHHNFKINSIKPKEQSAMNTEIKIETITLITAPGINQMDARNLTDDQLIDAISKANNQLAQLRSLVKDGNTSKKLAAKIEKLELNIAALTDLVDTRPAQ